MRAPAGIVVRVTSTMEPSAPATADSAPSLLSRGHASWFLRLVVLALVAAAVSAATSLVVASLAWTTATNHGASLQEALRVGGLAWVAGQGVPIVVNAVTIGLAPVGLGLVSIAILFLGSRRLVRGLQVRTGGDLAWLAGAIVTAAFAYAALVSWAADLSWRPDARASTAEALVRGGLLALGSLLAGSLLALQSAQDDDGAGMDASRLAVMPAMIVSVVRAGVIAAGLALGIGALLAALSLMTHFDDAVTIAQSLAAGIGGGLGLFLLCLAYVPVMAVWGTAYFLGAGVVIGPGVTSTPFIAVTAPTNLPAVPLLAAVPQQATPLAWLLPVLAIGCGLLAGITIAHGHRGAPRLLRAGLAVCAAAISGVILGLAALFASGPLGDLKLAYLGPVPTTVGVLAFVLIVLGAVPASILGAERRRGSHLTIAAGEATEPAQEAIGDE